jgi:hypothetical protein
MRRLPCVIANSLDAPFARRDRIEDNTNHITQRVQSSKGARLSGLLKRLSSLRTNSLRLGAFAPLR